MKKSKVQLVEQLSYPPSPPPPPPPIETMWNGGHATTIDSNTTNTTTMQLLLLQQQQQIETLDSICRKLQAQNILSVVQQLDIYTRFMAFVFYLWIWYYIYWNIIITFITYRLLLLVQYLVLPVLVIQQKDYYAAVSNNCTTTTTIHCCGINDVYNSIVTERSFLTTLLFIVWEVPYTLILYPCMTLIQHYVWYPIIIPILSHPTTMSIVVFLFFGIALPYYHHWKTYGLFYRRCDVFAVFIVFLLRMKLCRYRESIFVVGPNASSSTTSTASPDTDENNTTTTNTNTNANTTTATTGNEPTIESIPSYGSHIGEDDIWDANYEISARYLYMSILRLQGLWTKSAQYISSRADFMPIPYIRELQQLQDSAPPTAWETIVQQHMIPKATYEALIDIEPIPIASASIGQVHIAKLRATGEKVVIKVQHPQARILLTDDFTSLHIFCRIIQWLEPDYAFLGILMREWAIEAKKELDFIQEMNNLKDAKRSIDTMMFEDYKLKMNGTNHHHYCLRTNATDTIASVPFQIEIPRPYDTLCTSNVLVMSFCEGERIDDIKQMKVWNLNPSSVMDGVAQAFAYMMYVTSPFNGDPHAGNLLVRPGTSMSDTNDGFTIVILDWGLAKRLCDQQRKAFCQMAYAASTFDYGLLLDAFTSIGLQMKRENVNEDMEGIRFLLREIVPRDVSRKRIKAKIRTDTDRMNARTKKDKIPMESKAYPGEFFFFVRVNELMHGLGSKFGIHLNYVDLLQPYAERGLTTFAPYSDHPIQRDAPLLVNNSSIDTILQTKVTDVLNKLQREGQIAGAQVCILNGNGETVTNIAVGHCGGLKKRIAMRPDTLVLGFSCTKAVTATLAHRMVQMGYLTYDECICDSIWPAFCPSILPPSALYEVIDLSVDEINERWMWKRHITLRHILTHTAGMWWALPTKLTIQRLASCEQCVKSFEYDSSVPEDTLLPDSCPGSKTEYHFMSFGWLVAGSLMGAYSRKHTQTTKIVTYEQIYEEILLPLLSKTTITSGFCPCGGSSTGNRETFPTAFVETQDISITKIQQMQREAEAFGEADRIASSMMNDTASTSMNHNPQNLVKGKEFLLDQRIWNCAIGLRANCPAAGGRFSAQGLAHFYHDLGTSNSILNDDTLALVTAPVIPPATAATSAPADTESSISFAFQGPTSISSINNNNDMNAPASSDESNRRALGFGYQVLYINSGSSMTAPNDAFGHAGVGGSIGLFHQPSKVSIGIMLNKIDGDTKMTTPTLLRTIQQHFHW